MSGIELVAFAFGAAAVALAAGERALNFPVGMGMSVAFGILFLDTGLYANAALQVVYLALAAWGWSVWVRGGREFNVRRASPQLLAVTGAGVVALTVLLYPALRALDDPAPFLDALTAAMSLGAQALLNLKRLETWYLWLAVDAIYVPFYADQGLWLTAVVYVGFLGLCLAGLRHWSRAAAPARHAEAPA
jgi:nicotinamide mononucleotide transporter